VNEIFSWFLRSGVSRWGGCLSFFFASFFRFSVFLSPPAPLVFAGFCRFFLLIFMFFTVIIVSWFGFFPFVFSFSLGVFVVSVPVGFRGRVLSVFAFRSVAASALRFGCVSWSVGGSALSFSGSCVRAVFASSAAASAFASCWAARVGFFCAVRPQASGGFVVSVPVAAVPSSRLFFAAAALSSALC
jgi:hypothetical protein